MNKAHSEAAELIRDTIYDLWCLRELTRNQHKPDEMMAIMTAMFCQIPLAAVKLEHAVEKLGEQLSGTFDEDLLELGLVRVPVDKPVSSLKCSRR